MIFVVGVFISICAGFLFTANNFMINQFQVVVSDAVVVRCVLQIIIYSAVIFSRGERILPTDCTQMLLTLLQGFYVISCLGKNLSNLFSFF